MNIRKDLADKKIMENLDIEKEEFKLAINELVYSFGYDDDGYYYFKWDSEFDNVLDKKMFATLDEYELFLLDLIQNNNNLKKRGTDISLGSCKSRFTIDKLRRQLDSGYEDIFTYEDGGKSFGFNHTKTHHYMCYENIDGCMIPELIERYNQYTGNMGKDLFIDTVEKK